MGDFNVAPQEIDIGIGENNKKRWLRDGKCAFLPEEIALWESIKDIGFVDTWREFYPEENSVYSWFDYRSRMFDDWDVFSVVDPRDLVRLRKGYEIEITEILYSDQVLKVKLLDGRYKGKFYYAIADDLAKKYLLEEKVEKNEDS